MKPGPTASAARLDYRSRYVLEAERYAVADHVVSQLKEHGDPWDLSEEARPKSGPTTVLVKESDYPHDDSVR